MNTGFPVFLPDSMRFKRFMVYRDLPYADAPSGICRWCGEATNRRGTRWCGDECIEEYKLRAWGSSVRNRVFARDNGICSACGRDTKEMVLEVMRIVQINGRTASIMRGWRSRIDKAIRHEADRLYHSSLDELARVKRKPEHRWEADHIIPVVEGGGCCGLQNYRTLCGVCHARATKILAGQRSKRKEAT